MSFVIMTLVTVISCGDFTHIYKSLYREENIEKIENEARKEHMTIIRRINRK